MAVELVTQAEYARRREVSREAVRKAVMSGRITTIEQDGKKLIDPAVADIQWAVNTDRKQFERANGQKIAAAVPPTSASSGETGSVYFDARARREEAEATMAELELEKMRGTLVERQKVEEAAMRLGRMLRDSIMGVPTKIAPSLAEMADAFQVEQALSDALRQILDNMSKLTSDDMDKAMQ